MQCISLATVCLNRLYAIHNHLLCDYKVMRFFFTIYHFILSLLVLLSLHYLYPVYTGSPLYSPSVCIFED